MQVLDTNQAQVRHTDAPAYNYPLGRQGRRLAPLRKHAQLAQMPNGDAHADGLRHSIVKRGRFWNVIDPLGDLVCVTVYKRGAEEVIRRLDARQVGSSASAL